MPTLPRFLAPGKSIAPHFKALTLPTLPRVLKRCKGIKRLPALPRVLAPGEGIAPHFKACHVSRCSHGVGVRLSLPSRSAAGQLREGFSLCHTSNAAMVMSLDKAKALGLTPSMPSTDVNDEIASATTYAS